MKKLLWIGDAGVPSGFARSTHEILDVMRLHFDVTVLGINYRGDPHSYPYPIYAASVEGDGFGLNRLIWMCDLVKPDVIVIQNDPWNFSKYLSRLSKIPDYKDVPVIGIVAVDGKNCVGTALNGLALAVFWTEFGLAEARAGGYTGPAMVIPLGVNTELYHPLDKYDARSRKFPDAAATLDDVFIVGNVNRNQPRKRLDLTVRYFAHWILQNNIQDAYLYLHVAPTGDTGVSVKQLAQYYGILSRLILAEPATWYGDTDREVVDTYNCFDVQVSTTQGEGFGLTTFEGMACGVPQIVPDWAALGELVKDAAVLVPCSTTAVGPPYVNVIGGVADEAAFIAALDRVYRDQFWRSQLRQAGFNLVSQPKYNWKNIAKSFNAAALEVVDAVEVAV